MVNGEYNKGSDKKGFLEKSGKASLSLGTELPFNALLKER
jgi:hypothetical protein